jgi:predicted acetyltransferase
VTFEIVDVGPDDLPEAILPVLGSYGKARLTDEELHDEALQYADYRTLAARADGQWVGAASAYRFELTVPGGGVVDACGVTMVGVRSTHRRRGILTALMGRLLDEAAERGEPVAVLMAEEAPIYPRFGFGAAAMAATARLEAAHSAYSVEPTVGGSLRMVDDPAEAVLAAAEVWERHRRWRPGTITRRPWMWEFDRLDRESRREGGSALFWVFHHDDAGVADGYTCYRMVEKEVHGLPRDEAVVVDLVGVDAEVEAVLLRHVCSVDLVHEVVLEPRPIDDPLRHRLVDPRRMAVTDWIDWLWVRALDVPAAFGARTYGTTDRLVVEVEDRFRPAWGGRFAVDGSPAAASVERTTDEPDLVLAASALASLHLGTFRPSVLADAGHVTAAPEVLARADAFFASTPSPFSCTQF